MNAPSIEVCTTVHPIFICGWGEPKYFARVKPEEEVRPPELDLMRQLMVQRQENHSAFWDILASFGFPELRRELEGKNVYRLDNVMTLNIDMMCGFYCLRLWLEEIDGHVRLPLLLQLF
jgi:hypothetical protein